MNVPDSVRAAVDLCAQVGERTRAAVILSLAVAERSPASLVEEFGFSPAALSHHLNMLRAGGLVVHRRGRVGVYGLTPAGRHAAEVVQLAGARARRTGARRTGPDAASGGDGDGRGESDGQEGQEGQAEPGERDNQGNVAAPGVPAEPGPGPGPCGEHEDEDH